MPVCTKLCVKGTGGHGITHTIDGLIGFVCIFAFFYLVVNRWRIFYGPALCASGCIIAVFIGREFSDRQKLGYWDWEGLLVPSITFLVVAILISFAHYMSTHRRGWFAYKDTDAPFVNKKKMSMPHKEHTEIRHAPGDTLLYTCNEERHPDSNMRLLIFMPQTCHV